MRLAYNHQICHLLARSVPVPDPIPVPVLRMPFGQGN